MSIRNEQKQAIIKDAISALCLNPNFAGFITLVRDMRENAVQYMVTHTTVKDEREMLAAVGEVRAYDAIVAAYEDTLQSLEKDAERQQEQEPA